MASSVYARLMAATSGDKAASTVQLHDKANVSSTKRMSTTNFAPVQRLAWTADTARHVEWFLSAEPPTEPFQLKQAVYVVHPALFWQRIRAEVPARPTGLRAHYGTLQDDLWCLYEMFGET